MFATTHTTNYLQKPDGEIYIDVSGCQGWHKAGLKERKRRDPKHQRGCEAGCGAQQVFARAELNDEAAAQTPSPADRTPNPAITETEENASPPRCIAEQEIISI